MIFAPITLAGLVERTSIPLAARASRNNCSGFVDFDLVRALVSDANSDAGFRPVKRGYVFFRGRTEFSDRNDH